MSWSTESPWDRLAELEARCRWHEQLLLALAWLPVVLSLVGAVGRLVA
jgi:hypothetical protein